MAKRRMFSLDVIDTDEFLDMPATTQNLYFHLGMRGDDDGFVSSPKKIMKMTNASDDDLNVLFAKKFIIGFETGIIVIRHWKIHNYIQSDRYTKTIYQDEKEQLKEENRMYTKCIQNGSTGKISKDKISKDKISKGKKNNYFQNLTDVKLIPVSKIDTQKKEKETKQNKYYTSQIEHVSDSLETVEDKSEEQNRTEQNKTEQNRTEKENEIFKFIIDGFYQYHNKQYRFTDKETGIAKRISIDLAKYDNWDDILKAKINGLKKKVDTDKKEFWSFTISKLEYGWNEFTEIKKIESSNQTDAIINHLKDKGYAN